MNITLNLTERVTLYHSGWDIVNWFDIGGYAVLCLFHAWSLNFMFTKILKRTLLLPWKWFVMNSLGDLC